MLKTFNLKSLDLKALDLKSLLNRLSPVNRRVALLSWGGYALSRGADILDVTFGNVEWFLPRQGWSLPKPRDWRGRAYFIAWGLVIFVPAAVLMLRDHNPEATVWLASSVALMGGDLRRTLSQPRSEVIPEAKPVDASTDLEREIFGTTGVQAPIA